MCGITGYIGKKQAAPILLRGLEKLEYRGYDSAGIAVRENSAPDAKINIVKAKGRLKALLEKTDCGRAVPGLCGIGHTRWATHGEPSELNAHPHCTDDLSVVLVHNGIIENYQEIREKLTKSGYRFYSQTDTEAAVKLIDSYYKQSGEPLTAISQAMLRIRRLNPKPGSQYTSHSRSPYILPDVTMIKFVDEYYVALNDYSLPRIRINEEYQNMLLRARGEEHREEREYLEEKIADAKLLQEQIAFRGRTLLEVTKALIKLQEPFFRYGPRYTKLLPIQELAQALSMPEELVSATLKNKYLQSPFGVYPMKYFLAREHHPQQEGMEAIRQQLAQLIRGEHPDEPYTDEQLAQLMAKDGVFMTEELVERLREELNIPDSEHRIFYDPQSEEEHCCDDDCGHHHH